MAAAASVSAAGSPAKDGPVAVVTGGGKGIGLATARELARRGYRLALIARSRDDLAAASAETGAMAVPADVSRLSDIESAIGQILARFGRIDALVNNAGFAPMMPIEQFTPELWQATIDTNLSAVFQFCRLLWPTWRKQGGGVVVNVSSMAAKDPFDGLGVYGAAKAGVNLLGMALAREGEPVGIRVHTIGPGAVETGMLRAIASVDQLPAENTMAPEDVARVIVQCICGDLRYSSGEVIYLHRTMG
jgi:NAD(P)-dependent dehydrogenase (short-subunit alcohol dehydrogenase family)